MIAAIITAAAAIVALVGVKLQVDASYRVQREKSAKEICRELLNLSIANPAFVAPDHCTLKQSPKFPAYESYVDDVLQSVEHLCCCTRSLSMASAWGLPTPIRYVEPGA